jgi:serine/threonine protein kinase
MDSSQDPFDGASRFRIERCLGRGGYGAVYLAHDLKRGTDVALKALQNLQSGSLYRFKQEFRSLADLRHPNLVRLFELFSDSNQWFFTMEFVDGVDFLRYVRLAPSADPVDDELSTGVVMAAAAHPAVRRRPPAAVSYDPVRLRTAVRQLTRGVRALHAAGKLHRDLKPSNVLVTPEGRVVVLDFGLVKELDSEGHGQSLHVVGTPVYMSPEQGYGAPLKVASDWYSVGLMLYEIITGDLPFRGPVMEVLRRKETWQPDPRDFPAATPADLASICVELLRIEPDRRMAPGELLRRLSDETESAAVTSMPIRRTAPIFVGRRSQLELLHDAARSARHGSPATVLLHGGSGIGKTALVRHFLDELRTTAPDTAVLHARCYEQESVPYKGVDSLVDALVQYLRGLPPMDLQRIVPRELHVLERLFPVMEEIASQAVPWRAVEITDAWEVRRRGGRALRELMARLADFKPLVVFIDDVHWGDLDGARLLQEILRPPDSPALLLILAYRTEEAATSECVRELVQFAHSAAADLGMRELPLAEMSLGESTNLARSLSTEGGVSVESAAQIARESDGIPFFIHELIAHEQEIRHSQVREARWRDHLGGLDNLMSVRLKQVEPTCRTVLELLAVAGRPVERQVLMRASGLAGNATGLDQLTERRLIRSRRSGELEEFEIYHARMAKGVLMHLPAATVQQRHRDLALALEHGGRGDPETLYHHYHEAGDRVHAASFALAAAREASQALAFNRAADLYGRALADYPPGEPSLIRIRASLGDALAHAGRGVEAARAYLAATEGASPGETLRLQQLAVGQFFRTGRFDEGLATLRDLLPALRLRWPATTRRTLMHLAVRRLQLRLRGLSFRQADTHAVSAEQLLRIDASSSVSSGLSVIDPLRAMLFHTQSLLWALKAGEPGRLARLMALEAAFSALRGRRSRDRTNRLFQRADELTERVDTPEARGVAMVARGVAFYLYGEWRKAADILTQAETLLTEQCSEVGQERDNARVFALGSLTYLGELREVRARLPALLNDAHERGDLYAKTLLSLRASMMELLADNPTRARSLAADAITEWSCAGLHTPHYTELQRQIEIDLYVGDAVGARTRMIDSWHRLRGSVFLRNPAAIIEIAYLRGRACLAAAADGMSPRILQEARRAARDVERQDIPWSNAVGALIRGGIAATSGKRDLAAELLEGAERDLSHAEMTLHAAAARYRRGQVIGGSAGQALTSEADLWMREKGVVNPRRVTAMLLPGRF